MVRKAGIKLLFHASVIGVDKKGESIENISVSTVGGVLSIHAHFYIDCTGDADIAVYAGCPYHLGREDGLCQPMTLCFRAAGIDYDVLDKNRALLQRLYSELQSKGKIKNIRENVLFFPTVIPGVTHFNTTRVVKKNPVDAFDVTEAELEAREQAAETVAFIKENIPGCEHAQLLSTAMGIGVRESRMIDGEYTLTQEDLLSFRKFDDGIAACNYEIDIHNPEGSGTSHYFFPKGEYYTIPYRCLIPKGVSNLLVAGRCISSTHEAQASYRIMPVVCTLGEAAGVAASIAIRSDTAAKHVDSDVLRSMLHSYGAYI